ncbi:MAG: DNA-directed RNA polymerase subunit beta' [Clostridiaceae bacterium]|jgi:DNA-directed RNA polymerase subunit beta'|nr:DNA-directed RNA polymerase subunit beta' [Clostridiaceae bacterium]
MADLNHIEAIGIGLASPEKILEWSHGEVKKPETINYRTLKPEADGLFCEKIFGPTKDWECYCGKYKKIRYRGIVCDKCGVEVTRSKVRRERMGHIRLAAPVSHIWYFRGIPSRMGLLLDMSPRNLEKILYFAAYIVIDPKETNFTKMQIINERDYRTALSEYGRNSFVAKMGAEAIRDLLSEIDVDKLAEELHEELITARGQKEQRIIKRLEVVESFQQSDNRPEDMVLEVLPVLPPELRPMVQLDGGRFATSDLNDLYRRVINRNNRLNKLLQLGAPNIIVRNEKRMLQEAVDALIDNGRRGRAVTGAGNRPLKSLSDLLKGKQGRLRQNLLGKRVDYSGRSVIVVGPELKLHQCGLPKEMALELFKPFVMRELVKHDYAQNIKSARRLVERGGDIVWDTLDEVIQDHPVLLNRAPTLHRLGIQAFEPVLVEGRAIKLHPLVCTAFNADFDGDQMAVHVPLSTEAQSEARFLMLSTNNLLKPQDGKPVTVPTQDIVLGCYYMTMERDNPDEAEDAPLRVFSSVDEAVMAYENKQIILQQKVRIRRSVENDGKTYRGIVESTLGRFLFNNVIPQNLGYVHRGDDIKSQIALECDFVVGKREIASIIERCINVCGTAKTAEVLDDVKELGYHYATIGGVSIGVFDMVVPDVKEELISEAEVRVDKINTQHQRGLLNDDGRYRAVVDTWRRATNDITEALKKNLDPYNPIYMMSQSGARGSIDQIKQLAGMRGNMTDTSGRTIEIPIKSNLREGMNVLEFFISSHGARKSLSDTALKTADSGYLTRRLVDISQDVTIREEDCGTEEYIMAQTIAYGKQNQRVLASLVDRIEGRYVPMDIVHPETGKVIVRKGEMITMDQAKEIDAAGITAVPMRSVLSCDSPRGVCAKCYGKNLATGGPAVVGEAVGIMAAQSIGEPGTQLTMRTFHLGGIASAGDITQGLPRIEELFEARKPKGQAVVADISGVIEVDESDKRRREVRIIGADGTVKKNQISVSIPLLVDNGDHVEAGDLITDGSVNPHDIMKIKGARGVQGYIIREVLKVYKNNGVDINDKHVEIIVRQMLRKLRIDDPGDTNLLTGSTVDFAKFVEVNHTAERAGLEPATGTRILLGITKASLATESFLSAASFQETTRVLTDAAVKGKVDYLDGLKENVIIGGLIPAGTGVKRYRDISSVPVVNENVPFLQETADRVPVPSSERELKLIENYDPEEAQAEALAEEAESTVPLLADDLFILPADD